MAHCILRERNIRHRVRKAHFDIASGGGTCMTEHEVYALFESLGMIIRNDHFIYSSGKHGSAYVNKNALYPHARETAKLCRALARLFIMSDVDCVVGPEKGGIIISQWTGYHLSNSMMRHVPSIFAEKKQRIIINPRQVSLPPRVEDIFFFSEGYEKFVSGKHVLVVEDILTTGGTAKKVVELVREFEGIVVAVGALCNRGGVTDADVGDVPKLFSLLNFSLPSWDAQDCPWEDIPVNTQFGKGKEYHRP